MERYFSELEPIANRTPGRQPIGLGAIFSADGKELKEVTQEQRLIGKCWRRSRTLPESDCWRRPGRPPGTSTSPNRQLALQRSPDDVHVPGSVETPPVRWRRKRGADTKPLTLPVSIAIVIRISLVHTQAVPQIFGPRPERLRLFCALLARAQECSDVIQFAPEGVSVDEPANNPGTRSGSRQQMRG